MLLRSLVNLRRCLHAQVALLFLTTPSTTQPLRPCITCVKCFQFVAFAQDILLLIRPYDPLTLHGAAQYGPHYSG